MINKFDKKYLDLLVYILENGIQKEDRTGTGTLSIFDYTIKHSMKDGFPLLTSKKMFMKGVVHELIWFLRGDTNIRYLLENNVNIWTGDAYKAYCKYNKKNNISISEFVDKIKSNYLFGNKYGELGPIYGKQWTKWNDSYFKSNLVNQIDVLIDQLNNNPDSRRMLVTAWNPSDLNKSVLPPCHYGFQCYSYEMDLNERIEYFKGDYPYKRYYSVDKITYKYLNNINFPKRKLSLKWTQRSVDSCLGLPFNFASYGLLLELLSKEVNMIPNELIFTGGDCHIYNNHIDGVKEQLNRELFELPKIKLSNKSMKDFKYEDFNLIGYKSSKKINYKLSN